MAGTQRVLFSSEDYRVEFLPAAQPARALVITFTEFSNRLLDGPGFGGEFLHASQFDVLAVKTRLDHWYQDLPPAALSAMRHFLAGRDRGLRTTYGSSMGGYAAIRYAAAVDADHCLALSPQFDVTQPWDRRWAAYYPAGLPFRPPEARDISPRCRYFLAYDPHDADSRHLAPYRAMIPAGMLVELAVPYAGHPCGYALREAGLLSEWARAICAGATGRFLPGTPGGPLPSALRQAIRAGRRRSERCRVYLAAACNTRRKPRMAHGIMQRLLETTPMHDMLALAHHVMAMACAATNRGLEARMHAAASHALEPWVPFFGAYLAQVLVHTGWQKQAEYFIDHVVAEHPGQPQFQALQATIKAKP